MKFVTLFLSWILLATTSWAIDFPSPLVLDKIQFQVSSKQWVSTQTALLNISINVTLSNADLVKARADIMDSLYKVAKGEWHILAFERSQDNSGLEKLDVKAQARVDQGALTDIYQNAKSVSMPGAKYEVNSVEFKPSLEETQVIRAKIREKLYQLVNDEITRMNKAYPNQNYSISQLIFVEGDAHPEPRAYEAKQMNVMMAQAAAPLSVSNELLMTAFVEAASNRKEGN